MDVLELHQAIVTTSPSLNACGNWCVNPAPPRVCHNLSQHPCGNVKGHLMNKKHSTLSFRLKPSGWRKRSGAPHTYSASRWNAGKIPPSMVSVFLPLKWLLPRTLFLQVLRILQLLASPVSETKHAMFPHERFSTISLSNLQCWLWEYHWSS